jgi:helicase
MPDSSPAADDVGIPATRRGIPSLVSALLQNDDLRSEIEQLRISALKTRLLGEWSAPDSVNLACVQRNLVLINRTVRRLASSGTTANVAVERAALFVAKSYEQLVEQPGVSKSSLLITAAINYELAGYQANAATLARLATPLPSWAPDDVPSIEELASLFLQRRFLRTSLLTSAGALQPRRLEEVGASDLLLAATAVTALAVAAASQYFLSGDPAFLSSASDDLELARQALLSLGSAPQANVVDGLRALLPRLQRVSVWEQLDSALPNNRLWRRYLTCLGRGLGGDGPLESRSISELWPSQVAAVHAGLLSGGSRIVRMPTSAGKTRVAELALIHSLATHPGSKALYVAPFNALTSELTAGFNDLFVDLGLSLSSLSGTYEVSAADADALEDDLLILTPEKLDQLLRLNSEFLDQVLLVVLDEGHIVGEEGRGPKYELAISRLRRRCPRATFIALSAVVPDQTLEQFSSWLHATENPISSDWRPTVLREALLDWDGSSGRLIYPAAAVRGLPDSLGLDDGLVVPAVIEARVLEHQNPRTKRIRRPTFPGAGHRAQVVAAYAWQVVDQGPVLVYCSTPQSAQAVATALSQRVDYAQLRQESVPAPLTRPAMRSASVAAEWLGDSHVVTRLLREGIGVHFASLPDAVRAAIETDFRERRLALLAATPTLA